MDVGLILSRSLLFIIDCEFEIRDSLRWTNILILWNCLDKVIYYFKWLGYIFITFQWSSILFKIIILIINLYDKFT